MGLRYQWCRLGLVSLPYRLLHRCVRTVRAVGDRSRVTNTSMPFTTLFSNAGSLSTWGMDFRVTDFEKIS